MHKNLMFSSFLFILTACVIFMTTSVHSAGIKERMAARIPAINQLKTQGAIGESNKGFLVYRTGSQPQAQLVAAENKDRALVYGAIAKQQGAQPALVGERRAKMIAQKGSSGHWYQRPDGSWYKK